MSNFFHTHAHSHYSTLDGMSPVKEMIARVIENKQPGMALTDHGNMSGTFQLYKGLRKAGLLPFPGIEAYLVSDIQDKTAKRYHVTMFALTTEGYFGLVQLTTQSHQRENYHFKPLMDFAMLEAARDAGILDGVVATTGCWFGWVQQAFEEHAPTVMMSIDTFDQWTTEFRGAYRQAEKRAKRLASIFPNFFVEAQHHHQDADDVLVLLLHVLAVECGLPFIITQDAHYCDRGEVSLHGLMKALAYGGDPGDVSFPGDSYHLASTQWIRSHYIGMEDVWSDAESTYTYLIDNHAVSIPWLDKYQYHIPKIVDNPQQIMVRQCLKEKTRRNLPQKYADLLDYECDIIGKLGFADYFILIARMCNFCHERGILINARGSANGSLVCWLMGITEIDPILWKTNFDRFLSLDRERPPDIDMDIEFDRREEVIAWLRQQHEVANIGTYMRLGVSEDEDRGGIFVTFLSSERRRLGDVAYKATYGAVKGLNDLRVVKGNRFVDKLLKLGEMKVYRSPGVHAAGYLLGTKSHPIAGQMPLMLIPSSETMVTQMTMEDVEDGGWTKVDLLGLRTLSVMRRAMKMVGMKSWHEIPLNDSKVMSMLRQGRMDTGVFQLEGGAASRGCREVKVNSVHDLILVNALYRPATMNAGHKDTYLRNRNDKSRIIIPHPLFAPILEPTYGIPVYQEQVMDMLRALTFPTIELNRMLKAIKASNGNIHGASQTFNELKSLFIGNAAKAGLSEEEADEAWDFISTFNEYSFNKAHSTAYGLLGYRTAWMKVHHPLEYQTALLSVWAGTKNENRYVAETRRTGIRILPADINISGASWTIDKQRNAIRRGLVSIKGVGEKAAIEIAENRPYSSVQDLIDRTNGRIVTGGKTYPNEMKGVLAALHGARALQSVTGDDT